MQQPRWSVPVKGPLRPEVVLLVASSPGYVAIGYVGRFLNPALITISRMVLAAAAVGLMWAVWRRGDNRRERSQPFTRADLVRVVVCGLLGYTGYSMLLAQGQKTLQSGMASLLINTAPVLTTLAGMVLLQERPTARRAIGTGLAFAGTATIALASGGAMGINVGALWVIAASLSLTAFVIVQQPLLEQHSPFRITAATTLSGAALSLLLLPWASISGSVPVAQTILALVVLGVVFTATAYTAWAYVLARLGAGGGTLILFAVPAASTTLGAIFLHERPTPVALLGGLLAILGVGLSQSGDKGDQNPRRTTGSVDESTETYAPDSAQTTSHL
jgi:drug/metabolite transporter (DMT)-like permease